MIDWLAMFWKGEEGNEVLIRLKSNTSIVYCVFLREVSGWRGVCVLVRISIRISMFSMAMCEDEALRLLSGRKG